MSLAVVRCPACRGASRVTVDSLGHMVGCPRCQVPFVAEEEIPVVQPAARPTTSQPNAPRRNAARTAVAVPVAPPRRRPAPPPAEQEPTAEAVALVIPDPEHDPHLPPVAGLPVSVLVGLALLPFGIPLLWLVAPPITGQAATLSLAVPVALAIAASALCLGVVYTIDWTAATRIKGVLMLVGLAYLSAAGLFFLKKDMMERVRVWGDDPKGWTPVSSKDASYSVKMPNPVWPDKQQPLPGLVRMSDVRRASYQAEPQAYDYRFAVSEPAVRKPDDAWFNRVREKVKDGGGKLVGEDPLTHQDSADAPGRQWTFELADNKTVRVVRVFVIKSRVYYLSAEGPGLTPNDEEFGKPFFGSFFANVN